MVEFGNETEIADKIRARQHLYEEKFKTLHKKRDRKQRNSLCSTVSIIFSAAWTNWFLPLSDFKC